jgi:hypothetical protein
MRHGGGESLAKKALCKTEGCGSYSRDSSGLCKKHGTPAKLCEVVGCKAQARGKLGLCQRHITQQEKEAA